MLRGRPLGRPAYSRIEIYPDLGGWEEAVLGAGRGVKESETQWEGDGLLSYENVVIYLSPNSISRKKD